MIANTNLPETITVELPIIPEVLAQHFGSLITAIDELYYTALWLDRAEQNKEGIFPDDNFGPQGLSYDDYLWVEFISIGTPNKARLRGKRRPLATAAVILATIWGGAKGGAEFAKTATEVWKISTETRIELQIKDREAQIKDIEVQIKDRELKLKDIEITERELDLIEKTRRLYEAGQISKFAHDYKHKNLPQMTEKLEQSVNLLDPTRKIVIGESQ